MARAITIMQDKHGVQVVSLPLDMDDLLVRDLLAQALTIVDNAITEQALASMVSVTADTPTEEPPSFADYVARLSS
jgi:hypothetical protein